jgi:two-component system response regulator NreC
MKVNLRILVADAHASMRCRIVSLLWAEFDVVGAVSDGDELVKAALETKPDVIVSGICMPKLTGMDAEEFLQALGINIPFVFVSTKSYFTEKGMRGLGQCVTKEDLESNLNAAVESAVSKSSFTH